MSFSHLLRKSGQSSFAHSDPTDAETNPHWQASADDPDDPPQHRHASESTSAIHLPWRKKRPSAVDGQSQLASPTPLIPKAQSPPSDGGMAEMTPPAIGPVPDTLTEAWDAVKDNPKIPNMSRELDAVGDTAAATLDNAAPFLPVIKAAVVAAEQTDFGKAMKEGIGKLSEGMPIFMNALDELKAVHPFIGVVVLAFKTVYTLEQKRRDNDKKIVALFVGMRDMMGALLLLKGVENDKLIAPDGTNIEDRLKSLVERTADNIKMCSNVCDAYVKKRLLAKVLLSPVWDAKLLDFVRLFATRRQEFEFELTMHTSQGVDKANVKLDAIGDATRALNEQMDIMKDLFRQLVSPEQKQLSDLVAAKGGMRALKGDDKTLLELEKAAEKASSAPKAPSAAKADVGRARREKSKDTSLSAEELRRDILEDPNVSVEKNLTVFSRKFEAQKNQIVDELTLVVKRESDRVIQEVKGGPHERILDRSIHEVWSEMGWRGNVKARHFVLALRDHYQEKLAAGNDDVLGMGAAGVHCTPDPDAWAIKYIDILRLQPILESIDDDASGFITIVEINRFTASRPIYWSLPHWVAFWAAGYRASIIDYAFKIEDLLAKMDGVRAEVLPLNIQAIVDYFSLVWNPIHTLIVPVLSLQPLQDDSDKFKSYLEAEEARLENNLRAVDYVIDGIDTLTLITGVGRVEKTVFPLLYLLIKHHYEIMRIMRTKIVDSRELLEGTKSMLYIQDALGYRVGDLYNSFSQQKLDIEKQFQNFAYGMFMYFNNPGALWSGDYTRNLETRTTPYDDANEDQNIKLEDVLKYESSDEPSLDFWVYDGHSIDDIPTYRDVESPLKDILGHWHGYFYASGGVRETEGTDSMVTMVIEPAEGEQDFKANAWSNRGRFTITGSCSKDENDAPQITFKMVFPNAIWPPMFFDGHFDIERNALTGVWGYSSGPDGSMGPMEFRRIPPRYLTVYPSIHDLSTDKPRSLWKFAIAAVRNDVRRERCSWSYLSQRRDDRKTVVSFTARYLFFGNPISDEEALKLCDAVQRLTAADACFYGSIISRERAYTLTHGTINCDSCGGCIGGARLFCLDCLEKEGDTYDTLDLCCARESRCIEARVTHRQDLDGPHEPYHRLVKLRAAMLVPQFGKTFKLALAAFERVEEFCARIAEGPQHPLEEQETGGLDASAPESNTAALSSESVQQEDVSAAADDTGDLTEAERTTTTEMLSENDRSDDVPAVADGSEDEVIAQGKEGKDVLEKESGASQSQPQNGDLPTCGKCDGSLSFPFWYCIFCEDNLFICDACDSNGVPELTRSSGKHSKEHHLIRCLAPNNGDDAVPETEQRLMSIESRLDDLSGQIEGLTGRIGNIEQLLHKLAGTAGTENGSAQA